MFAFHMRHAVADNEHYRVDMDELRRPEDDAQLLVLHIDFHQFSKTALQRLLSEWAVFRSVVSAPLFAFCQDGEEDPGKWERFVRLLGFEEVPHAGIPASDGSSRRIFVSHKAFNVLPSILHNEQQSDGQSLGPANPVPDAGVR